MYSAVNVKFYEIKLFKKKCLKNNPSLLEKHACGNISAK